MSPRSHLEPVQRESTPSLIARQLRNAIASGELVPGSQLGEAELARELGVSRGPLREAMQRLTQEGLLLAIRNRGLFVKELTEDDVHDVYVARAAVERAAAEQVIRRDPAGVSKRLSTIIDRMERAADRKNALGIGEADLDFHETLVELSESPRLIRMHQTLLTETRMCVIALGGTYPVWDKRVPEHREIAAAIAAGDRSEADRLIVAHMDDAVHRLVPKFSATAQEADA